MPQRSSSQAELRLKQKLAKADAEGSLFDLHNDRADQIGRVIAESISPRKAKEIAKAITARLDEKKARHAG